MWVAINWTSIYVLQRLLKSKYYDNFDKDTAYIQCLSLQLWQAFKSKHIL